MVFVKHCLLLLVRCRRHRQTDRRMAEMAGMAVAQPIIANPGYWPVMIFANGIGTIMKNGRFRRRRFFCSGVLRLETGRSREYRAIALLAARSEAVIAGGTPLWRQVSVLWSAACLLRAASEQPIGSSLSAPPADTASFNSGAADASFPLSQRNSISARVSSALPQ